MTSVDAVRSDEASIWASRCIVLIEKPEERRDDEPSERDDIGREKDDDIGRDASADPGRDERPIAVPSRCDMAEPGRVATNSRRRGDGGFGVWPRGVASSDRGDAGEGVGGRFGSDDGQSGSITVAAGLRREV